jgi:PAS domain S-box-containing protein
MPTPDFRTLFESAPDLYIVLAPDLTIVAVSDAYLRATHQQRERILGRYLFDAFPENPDDPSIAGVHNIRTSLERVLRARAPDTMAVQRYDLQRDARDGGGFETRYWSLVSYPLLDQHGQVAYIIHRVEDVTDFIKLQQLESEQHKQTEALRTRAAQMEGEIYRRIQQVQTARRDAEHQRERLYALFMQAPAGIAMLRGPSMIFELANAPYRQLVGRTRPLDGKPLLEAIPELDPEIVAILQRVYATGERFIGTEYPVVLDWDLHEQPYEKFITFVYEPIRTVQGQIEGILAFAYDVTEHVLARRRVEESETRLRAALAEAEAAQRRLAFLAEASATLTSLTDYRDMLQHVARLAVPTLADFCFFDLLHEDGALQRVAWAHGDPAQRAFMNQTSRYAPPSSDWPHPITAALTTGRTVVVDEVTDDWLRQIAVSPAHLQFLRALDFHAYIVVPVIARDHTIGALSFCLIDHTRQYAAADRELAEELARRAALAIENARLYEAEQRSRIEAEQRLAELTAIVDSIPDAVYVGTAESITRSNQQALEMLGYDSPDDLHHSIGELADQIQVRYASTGKPVPVDDQVFSRALEGERAVNEVLVRNRKTGEDRVVRSAAAPIRHDGQIIGAVAINTDITERKQAEVERAQMLAREQAARAEAEAAVQIRDEFLSVAAHELKTPVTSMRGYAQVLLRRLAKGQPLEPERVQRALDAIDQQSEKLTRFVDQLLDISRISAGRLTLNLQPTDLGRLAADVAADLQQTTQRHRFIVEVDHVGVAQVDPLRLEQVLTNLITNAVKYSPEGGPVMIRAARPSADLVQIVVTDQGIGIPPEHRPYIFDRFYQAHGSGYFGGLGLGLSISQQIVQLHGGRLEAEFPDDGGTRLVISLPVAPTAESAEQDRA